MRRKALPGPWNGTRRPGFRNRRNGARAYIISGRAQAVLSTVLEGIIEEALEDAKNLAKSAGKNWVSREDMEKALKKLCLRFRGTSNATGSPDESGDCQAERPDQQQLMQEEEQRSLQDEQQQESVAENPFDSSPTP
ncbi:uncharacterized protein LOC105702340 [Orussus abietinus]|uniref:uncharacterized protein LOC105702340 n=1 Tax=Orussus abietinus TaxID=222816 RepID=UPI00062644DE|nr:uncharacterized protein LOC105702340 [Orussus abietinus]